jgi:hypothetical protein
MFLGCLATWEMCDFLQSSETECLSLFIVTHDDHFCLNYEKNENNLSELAQRISQ